MNRLHCYEDAFSLICVILHLPPQKKAWTRRARDSERFPAIGRMVACSLKGSQEKYYLRVLLAHTPGAKSYNDLATVGDHLLPTFKEACIARGLLADDAEWRSCMEEAASFKMPRQLRGLFATLLQHVEVAEPLQLWDHCRQHLLEDFAHAEGVAAPSARMEARGLREVDAYLFAANITFPTDLSQRLNAVLLSAANEDAAAAADRPVDPFEDEPQAIREILDVDREHLRRLLIQWRPLLTPAQNQLLNSIVADTAERATGGSPRSRLHYADAPAGGGKTTTINCIIALELLAEERAIVIVVASTGIAALLLEGSSSTAHLRFRIPINLTADSICSISR
jgi:hypothetical protein